MDLPYELQFNYLLQLSQKEIMRYCQVNANAAQICRSREFWEQKARQDLGISGQITEEEPALEYAHLEEAYRQYPEVLLPQLVRAGDVQNFARLLSRATLVRVQEENGEASASMDPSFNLLIRALCETGNRKAFELLLNRFDAMDEILRDIAMENTYLDIVGGPCSEWIEKYWDPSRLNPVAYYNFIVPTKDLATVLKVRPLVRIEPVIELGSSFYSDDPEVRQHFLLLHSNLLNNPKVVEGLIHAFTEEDHPVALSRLLNAVNIN